MTLRLADLDQDDERGELAGAREFLGEPVVEIVSCRRSEVDKRESPACIARTGPRTASACGRGIPGFEFGERRAARRLPAPPLRAAQGSRRQRLRDRREARQHVGARLAVVLDQPSLVRSACVPMATADLFVLGGRDGFGDRAHQVEPAEGKSALPLQRLDALAELAAEVGFRGVGACRGRCLQGVEEGRCRSSPRSWRCGGREWESNPPRTGSRPLPDLKSGRPTGDDSLPEIGCRRPARRPGGGTGRADAC